MFFRDLSNDVLQDDVLARLLTFPNVLVTSHQAFLTKEALANIAGATLLNITAFERGESLINEVRFDEVLGGWYRYWDSNPGPVAEKRSRRHRRRLRRFL